MQCVRSSMAASEIESTLCFQKIFNSHLCTNLHHGIVTGVCDYFRKGFHSVSVNICTFDGGHISCHTKILEKNNIQGVWFEEDYLRVYPYNELACDTLGFTFSRDTADYGIEGYYNSSLTGIDGRQYGYFSDDSNVEQTIIEASDGNSLELSLDLGTQQIVEEMVCF